MDTRAVCLAGEAAGDANEKPPRKLQMHQFHLNVNVRSSTGLAAAVAVGGGTIQIYLGDGVVSPSR
jgi:hypothetical protein